MGILAGIGFTVALFVTDLAFLDEALLADSKVGILLASLLAALGGLVTLRLFGSAHRASAGD
jgi:NhaA family Na+:H+ antiporter